MRKEKGKYAVIGGLGGLANGLFGSGGGLFLVPLFTKWLGMEQKKAFASSVAVILPLSLVSAGIYFWKGALDLNAALPYLIGGGIGGLISGKIFQKMPVTLLRRIFGLLILYGGVRAVLAL
ncbi:sulfite exporter TauE/SafE family protein [Neglectibacter caecimuris]|uniref:sulfite exporter TauE/SafE family protein n=1 Tax=Neglectibacter caecimuris TaxID=3093658 RepID=UPI002AC9BD94|nr:sulfite exporter TauE/SafE family protein [Neglectibacter sp. M00184]